MTPLQNSRHEAFAVALAGGKSVIDAYAVAGFRRSKGNASRLAARKDIKARVLELKTAIAEKTTKKRADILAKLGEIMDVPVNVADVKPRDQIRASELYGKDIGMFGTDKQEVNTKIELVFSAREMKI
jgi:hypothetical protein